MIQPLVNEKRLGSFYKMMNNSFLEKYNEASIQELDKLGSDSKVVIWNQFARKAELIPSDGVHFTKESLQFANRVSFDVSFKITTDTQFSIFRLS